MTQNPLRYAVVGRGWRAQFFLRLAAVLPDRFTVTSVLTRPEGTTALAGVPRGVPVVHEVADLVRAERPEFVVTSVPSAANPGLVEALVDAGMPVLSETPPAPDADGLRRLWARVGASRRVQVAEQYLMLPDHAARLGAIRSGVLGRPTSAQVSSTHGYHAVSILRGMVGAGFAPAVVRAHAFVAPLADPLSREGWSGDATAKPVTTTIATIDFGDWMGLYDFTDGQWWNPLRARRIVVRGSLGELVDDRIVRLVDPRTPIESFLRRRQTGRDLNLEGFDLDHISLDGAVVYRNQFAGARLSDEEIAIATLLAEMGRWCRDEGDPPYPLAEACQDHLISLAIDESVATGVAVTVARQVWAAD